jgi:peptidoglycan/xylan/chitin deacetylase (PgdA/CDA1 family)
MYIPILTYHRVIREKPTRDVDPSRIAVSAQQFRSHLRLLRQMGYSGIGLNTYAERLRHHQKIRPKTLAISFDDGYEDNLTVALPILKEFGFTATIFGVTGHVGGRNIWDGGGMRLLSKEGWRLLRREGIDVGSHTVHHPHLPRLGIDQARQEIQESKEQLEDLLGESISTFAYPYGETNDAVEKLVHEAGYTAGYATDHAPARHEQNPFRVRRIVIFPKTTALQLAWKVQRWFPVYQDWKRR